MDILQELNNKKNLLDKALSEYKGRGVDYANAYKNYRVAVAKELLRLRHDENMPVTIAYDIARGNEEVAELKRQEIITESLYKSCQEAIRGRLNMKTIIQDKKECYFCHTTLNLHDHHIYFGKNRKISEQNGFKVWLCARHHNMSNSGVHFDYSKDIYLKQLCQSVYEQTHTRQEFMALVGKNYLGATND